MDNITVVAGLIFLSILILAVWLVNRQNKVWTLDLSEIGIYLVGRRKVLTQFQGHSAVFDPISFLDEKPGERVSLINVINATEGIRLTVNRNDTVRTIQWRDELLETDVVQEIVKVLYPEHLLQYFQLGLPGVIYFTDRGESIVYEQKGIETDQNYLKALLDLLVYLIETYPSILALGGEAIDPLIKAGHVLSSIAPSLVQDIALDTQKRIGADPSSYLCPRCLVRCALHKVSVSVVQQVKYYGCRLCHQSRTVVKWKQPIIAVLDNRSEQLVLRRGAVRENWFTRRRLFDFDVVEIWQATDEEVERFAIQVGNDPDVERKSRQKQVRCLISSGCEISENTRRILRSMFGQIEVIAVA